jgi:cobalt-zinc-cadmium resistance protein CzcA
MKTYFELLLRKKLHAVLIFSLLVLAGIYSLIHLSVDAVPDITNVQVMINSRTGALDPEQIEKSVTRIIETEMSGLPRLSEIRSLSKYGLSQVNLIFEDGTDLAASRNLITQRLQKLNTLLPREVTSEMAPPTTGLGEVFMYTVEYTADAPVTGMTEKDQLIYLRTIQEQIIRPELKKIPGIAEVDTGGGYTKEIHVNLDPVKMSRHGLRLEQVHEKLNTIGESFGGGYLEVENQQILVKTSSPAESRNFLANLPLKLNYSGGYVKLSDVATIDLGKPLRIGAATAGGKEVVLGTILMNVGSNAKEVTAAVEAKIPEIPLPAHVQINAQYSRGYLVMATLKTVAKNLLEGALLVVLILLIFIGRFSVAFVVAMAIPLSMCLAMLSMREFHITANLMSLGALDFGLLVDGAVVMIDNILRRTKSRDEFKESDLLQACREVSRPILLGISVIVLVYLPIFALEGTEGKLFHPMAVTVISALLGSMLVALVLMPIFGHYLARFAKPKTSQNTVFFAKVAKGYHALLQGVLKNSWALPAYVVVVAVVTVLVFLNTGSQFVPQLSEKDLVFGLARDSKVSLSQSIREQKEVELALAKLPEVEKVFSRLGTPESATDPMGVNFADTFVILKKDFQGRSENELIPLIEKMLRDASPTTEISATQPIEMRFNEMLEGSRADVSLRFYGPDLNYLLDKVNLTIEELKQMPEIREVQVDALTALRKSPALDVRLDFGKMVNQNVSLQTANLTLRSLMAGEPVGFYHEGLWRYPIVMRLSEGLRGNVESLETLPVSTMDGGQVRLKDIATLKIEDQVTTIARSFGQRYGAISIFLKGTDVAGFVKHAKERLASKLQLKAEYRMEWGGQFKNLERARTRLLFIVPLTLLAIFLLIYLNFNSMAVSALILSAIPFAVSGGWLALWVAGIDFSVSAAIGFIALMGISILNCMVLMEFILHLLSEGKTVLEAVMEGTESRLRPVLMTACVAAFGFLPMVFSHGVGAEVQRPLATVVVGGVITSTISTLFVIPFVMLRLQKFFKTRNNDQN